MPLTSECKYSEITTFKFYTIWFFKTCHCENVIYGTLHKTNMSYYQTVHATFLYKTQGLDMSMPVACMFQRLHMKVCT